MTRVLVALGLAALVLIGCGDDVTIDGGDTGTVTEANNDRFPDVVAATAQLESDGTWTFAVTISSPYDGPDRYADAWRLLTPDGREVGMRDLTHHHAGEQPFTRSLDGVEIPRSVTAVTIEGRDLVNGWGGQRLELSLDPQG